MSLHFTITILLLLWIFFVKLSFFKFIFYFDRFILVKGLDIMFKKFIWKNRQNWVFSHYFETYVKISKYFTLNICILNYIITMLSWHRLFIIKQKYYFKEKVIIK